MEDKINRLISPGYEKIKTFNVDPIGKPRMTQRDKWKKRPRVEAYYAFKDYINLQSKGFVMPDSEYHLICVIQMPKSWSKKKRGEMMGQPHRQKPDKDNIEKAFLDSLLTEDSVVWDGRVSKFWGEEGRIDVYVKTQI